MKVKDVQLARSFPESVSIAAVQLKSPFDDELQTGWVNDNCSLMVTHETTCAYKARLKKISSILRWISSHLDKPDVVVFPEYSFILEDSSFCDSGKGTFDVLKTFSAETNTIIIGNYYSQKDRHSISFVFIPTPFLNEGVNGKVREFLLPKRTVTAEEDDFSGAIFETPGSPDTVFRFWWNSTDNRRAYFQVLTCKDYLYYTSIGPLRKHPEIIAIEEPGIIFAPLCTPDMQTFESRATTMLRDIPSAGKDGALVSVFSNATSLPGQHGPIIAGRSQIVSPVDLRSKTKPVLERNSEGVIYAVINPFQSLKKPTQVNIKTSNRSLVKSQTFHFNLSSHSDVLNVEDVSSELSTPRHTFNPEALALIGCYRYYGFLRLHDYPGTKHALRERQKAHPRLSVDVHGIYGLHDIVATIYEGIQDLPVVRQLLRIRLWPMISNFNDFNNEHLAVCRVVKVFKFRGNILEKMALRTEGIMTDLDHFIQTAICGPILEKGDSEEYKDAISALENANAIISSPYDSDVSERERNEGKFEFLVVVKIHAGDYGPKADGSRERFEQDILASLLEDKRVRTVEAIEADQRGYFDGDYLFHIVGHLADLNDIVVGILQSKEPLHPADRLTTRVIITAEKITQGYMTSVVEPGKIPSSLQTMLSLVEHWLSLEGNRDRRIREIVPTAILMLSEEDSRKLLQTLYLVERFAANDEDWTRNFYWFSYASTIALAGSRLGVSMPYQRFKEISRSFVMRVGSALESTIRKSMCSLAEPFSIDLPLLSELCNETIRVVKKDGGCVDMSAFTLGNAQYLFEAFGGCMKEKYRDKWKAAVTELLKARVSDFYGVDEFCSRWKMWVASVCGGRDSISEFQRFVKVRNEMAHDTEGDKRLSPRTIFNGTFEGMRALDRLDLAERYIQQSLLATDDELTDDS